MEVPEQIEPQDKMNAQANSKVAREESTAQQGRANNQENNGNDGSASADNTLQSSKPDSGDETQTEHSQDDDLDDLFKATPEEIKAFDAVSVGGAQDKTTAPKQPPKSKNLDVLDIAQAQGSGSAEAATAQAPPSARVQPTKKSTTADLELTKHKKAVTNAGVKKPKTSKGPNTATAKRAGSCHHRSINPTVIESGATGGLELARPGMRMDFSSNIRGGHKVDFDPIVPNATNSILGFWQGQAPPNNFSAPLVCRPQNPNRTAGHFGGHEIRWPNFSGHGPQSPGCLADYVGFAGPAGVFGQDDTTSWYPAAQYSGVDQFPGSRRTGPDAYVRGPNGQYFDSDGVPYRPNVGWPRGPYNQNAGNIGAHHFYGAQGPNHYGQATNTQATNTQAYSHIAQPNPHRGGITNNSGRGRHAYEAHVTYPGATFSHMANTHGAGLSARGFPNVGYRGAHGRGSYGCSAMPGTTNINPGGFQNGMIAGHNGFQMGQNVGSFGYNHTPAQTGRSVGNAGHHGAEPMPPATAAGQALECDDMVAKSDPPQGDS